MALVVPDPTRTVPLPLREQADVRDRWLTQRLLDLLPGPHGPRRHRPVARRRAASTTRTRCWPPCCRRPGCRRGGARSSLLHRSDDGVTAAGGVAATRSASSCPPGRRRTSPGLSAEESQWAAVRRIVEQAGPAPDRHRRLGSRSRSPTGCRTPSTACSPRRSAPTPTGSCPAEELAVGWLETRLPEEIAALHALNRLVHEVDRRGLLPRRHHPGDDDGARRRLVDPAALPRPRGRAVVPAVGGPAARRRARCVEAGGGALLPAVPYDAVDRARRPRALRRRADEPRA